MGEIAAIWIKRMKHGPMDPAEQAQLVAGRGIIGNANQGGKRQVTIIDEAKWNDATIELGIDVDPRARRANIMLRGIELANSRGKLLRLGNTLIRVYGETRPCHQMDEAEPGLRKALDPEWRAGVFGEIVEGGEIRVGDGAQWSEERQFLLPRERDAVSS